MRVLDIDVDDELFASWRHWCAPHRQPFPLNGLEEALRSSLSPTLQDERPSAEHRDTFFMYGGTWAWMDEQQFRQLPSPVRAALTAKRRRVSRPKPAPMWPTQFEGDGDDRMVRWVEAGVRPSEHRSVQTDTWHRAAAILPNAHRLAGTFPSQSGPNCFGAVMGAYGVPGASDSWMLQQPFLKWLADHTTSLSGPSCDAEPGVVLTWHEHNQLAHAAVTIGDGWVLSKPSQSWSSPTLVWSIRDVIANWRLPGTRLSRHRLVR